MLWLALAFVLAVAIALSWAWSVFKASELDVRGLHVLITGGSDGLGLALAKQYALKGARVTIVARRQSQLDIAKREILAAAVDTSDASVLALSADVADAKAMQDVVAVANEFHGRTVDHIVCNAGITRPDYFVDQDIAVMRRIMDVNYLGVVHTIKAALPSMITESRISAGRRRRVVIVSSAAALIGFIGYAQYCSSKFALRGLAEGLRNELLLYDIDVSIYFPGNIDTKMLRAELKIKPQEANDIDGMSVPATPESAALVLLDGLSRRAFAITNEVAISMLRVLANGIAPRWNTPLELLLLPILVPIQVVFGLFMDSVVERAAKKKSSL
ncbi:hypothetical protein P43SY_003693 [Pythium insidiosum]|uniref:3-dehydrosphinganine reductase n=1 Tax=Pythium insidiosum TaxID=114742 RepID=A0AAD5Q5T5_PYTIN|nr:hypothetical protein P43SY_003693 [Pythium insidiosum]